MGYKAWILSYKDECFDKIGLRPSEKIKLMNGSLDCEFRCYEMFDGKNKDYKKTLNEETGRKPNIIQSDRKKNDFRGSKPDRPERRIIAAHSEDEDEKMAYTPGRKKNLTDKPFSKMRYKNDEDGFWGKKSKEQSSFKKPFKRKRNED